MTRLESVPALTNILALSLHQAWTGMSPYAPRVASFTFQHNPSLSYQGRAWFHVGGKTETTAMLLLRAGSVRRLLEAIQSAVLVKTPRVLVDMTDHYPSYEIGIHLGPDGTSRTSVGGLLTLHSDSQEDHRAPWRMTWKGESAWTESREINEALHAMRDELKMKKLEQMWAERAGIESDVGLRRPGTAPQKPPSPPRRPRRCY